MSAKRADVIGTNRANAIIVIACRTTIKGEKGRDGIHVELRYGGTWTTTQRGKDRGTIYGGLTTTPSTGVPAMTASSAARAGTS